MFKQLMNYLLPDFRFYTGEGDVGGTDNGDTGGDDGSVGGGDSGSVGRPDGLEESFWDAEKNEVRIDSLIKSHNDTRKSVHEKEEGIRERLMSEMQSARPANPEAYEVKELGLDNVPDGYEIKFDDDDPMIKMWRDMCFQNNSSNDQFMEGIRTWVTHGLETRVDPEAEQAKLGENGADRVQRIELLIGKHLKDQPALANALADTLQTASSIEAMEKLLEGVGESRLPDIGEGGFQGALTIDSLKEMMRDPRYSGHGRTKDNAYIAQVQAGFQKLYPGKASI